MSFGAPPPPFWKWGHGVNNSYSQPHKAGRFSNLGQDLGQDPTPALLSLALHATPLTPQPTPHFYKARQNTHRSLCAISTYRHINLLGLAEAPSTSLTVLLPTPSAPVPPPSCSPRGGRTITAFTTNARAMAVGQGARLISSLEPGLGNGSGLSL